MCDCMPAFCYLCPQGSDNSDIDDVFGCTTTASQTGSSTIGVDAIDTYNIADDRQNVGDSGRVSVCVCVRVKTYAGGLVSRSQTAFHRIIEEKEHSSYAKLQAEFKVKKKIDWLFFF